MRIRYMLFISQDGVIFLQNGKECIIYRIKGSLIFCEKHLCHIYIHSLILILGYYSFVCESYMVNISICMFCHDCVSLPNISDATTWDSVFWCNAKRFVTLSQLYQWHDTWHKMLIHSIIWMTARKYTLWKYFMYI